MQAKDKELAAAAALRARLESELQQLQADLDSSRTELLRVTGGDYGLANALEELRSLQTQLQHMRRARDALVTEVLSRLCAPCTWPFLSDRCLEPLPVRTSAMHPSVRGDPSVASRHAEGRPRGPL